MAKIKGKRRGDYIYILGPIAKSKQKTVCIADDQIKIVSIPCNPYLCVLTSLSCIVVLLSISIICNICLKRGIKHYLNANVF